MHRKVIDSCRWAPRWRMLRALMGPYRAMNGGAIPISSPLSTGASSSFSNAPILLLQRWRSKLFLCHFQSSPTAAASRHSARSYDTAHNWARPLSSLCILRAGFFSFATKTSSWSADQSPYDVLGQCLWFSFIFMYDIKNWSWGFCLCKPSISCAFMTFFKNP